MKRASIIVLFGLTLWPIAAGADSDRPATPIVTQVDKRFDPEQLGLAKGQTVTFVNHDRVRHNIALQDPDGHEQTGTVQDPGQSNAISFDQTGTYHVFCLIHPMMHLTVSVH